MQSKTFFTWLKGNALTIILAGFALLIIFNPNAKAWVLQKLAGIGLFKAEIEKEGIQNQPETASFSFTDESGTIGTTADLKGKVVFINFWASWCPPCVAEMPSMEALYRKFEKDDRIVFLFMNEDDKQKAKDFLEKHKYTIPLLSRSGPVPDEIFSGTLPTTIVIDKEGKIVLKHEGMAKYDSDEFIQQLKDLF